MDTTDNAGGARDQLTLVECRNVIYESLVRSGKIDMLKSHLSDVLRFSGWNSLIRERCTEHIQKEGFEHVNFSHMLCDVIPFGRAQVPPEIRASLRELLHSIAESHFTIVDDSQAINQEMQHASETYLPFIYQPHDKLPDYGDHSIFTQHPDPVLSPAESSPSPPASPVQRFTSITATSSPNNLSREIGGIVLLDRVDLDKENVKLEKEKAEQREKELKERERHERERVRQELEKERLDRLERERQEQKEQERQERKDRELQELKDRERTEHRDRRESSKERRERQNNFQQSLSVPSSPSTPRPDKKSSLTEAAMMMKLAQVKQPPSLASTLITATAAIAGKKSKHNINLNSDNDDDDEDDEELMDI